MFSFDAFGSGIYQNQNVIGQKISTKNLINQKAYLTSISDVMSQSSHVPNDGMSQSQIIGSNVSTVERMSQSQCSVMSGSFSGHLGLGMTQSQVEAWQEVMGSTRADDNVLDLSNQVKMKLQLYTTNYKSRNC